MFACFELIEKGIKLVGRKSSYALILTNTIGKRTQAINDKSSFCLPCVLYEVF